MITQPPPLRNQNEMQPSTNKGCKWVVISVAVLSLLLMIAIGLGAYFLVTYVRENQQRVRQVANSMKPAQMHPEFLELLNAIRSTLDEPSNGQVIGKVELQGSEPYVQKVKRLLEAKKYEDLNELLSACYKDKLMTKQGFFIYRLMINELAESKKLSAWVKATGSSHAHIVAGLKEKDWAWKARGSGYSNTVTEAGWQGFRMHLEKATKHYQLAVKEDENNSVALSLLVTIGLGRGQLEGTLPEIVKMGLERTPEDGMLAASISYYLTPRWHGSRQQVIAFVRDDLKRWPNSGGKFECMLDRLSLASQWGNKKFLLSSPATLKLYEEAIAKYRQQWPEGDFVVEKIAKNLNRNKCYTAAIAFCHKHEKDFREKSAYYFHLGKAVFFTRKYAEAQDLLSKAVEAGGDDADTYFYLGRAATKNKDYAKGREACIKAAEMFSPSDQWERGRTYAEAAMCVSMLSDYTAARTYTKKAVEIDPSQAYSWYLLGFAEYKLGNKKEAKAGFNKAVKLDSKYAATIRKECPLWKLW